MMSVSLRSLLGLLRKAEWAPLCSGVGTGIGHHSMDSSFSGGSEHSQEPPASEGARFYSSREYLVWVDGAKDCAAAASRKFLN